MGHAARRRRLLLIGTAALALAVTAIGVVTWRDGRERSLAAGPHREPLAITIERDGFADIELVRDGIDAAWRIDAPCSLAVNAQRLTPLIEALNAVSARYAADDVDLAGAGLTDSDTAVWLDGVRHRIGGPDLGGERRYLLGDGTVELVPEWIGSLVRGGLTAFAEPGVLPAGARIDADERLGADAVATLEAVQIIGWPPREPATVDARAELPLTLANGERGSLELLRTDRYVAIVRDGAGCAHLLNPDALASAFDAAPTGTTGTSTSTDRTTDD